MPKDFVTILRSNFQFGGSLLTEKYVVNVDLYHRELEKR